MGRFFAAAAVLLLPLNTTADDSWVQAYNAAFVRVKASGFFEETMERTAPGLLNELRSLGDCPATPDTFPFPQGGEVLSEVLASGEVRLAFQFPGSAELEEQETYDFPKAIWEILKEVVNEIALEYNSSLTLNATDYPVSAAAVDAVIAGEADMTDFFLRQWTLIPSENVQRRTRLTPGCTAWLATLSLSWNATRHPEWVSLDDLRMAGPEVVIPIYSTMQAFELELSRVLPNATFLDRPDQNFEANASDALAVAQEFQRGDTTVLVAAKSDLEGITTLTIPQVLGVDDLDFNIDDVQDLELRIDLPVGPFLRHDPVLTDSLSWHKNRDAAKTCPWVAGLPEKRCFAKGTDQLFAYDACPKTCLGVDVQAGRP